MKKVSTVRQCHAFCFVLKVAVPFDRWFLGLRSLKHQVIPAIDPVVSAYAKHALKTLDTLATQASFVRLNCLILNSTAQATSPLLPGQ
jgi:hypothetical protein